MSGLKTIQNNATKEGGIIVFFLTILVALVIFLFIALLLDPWFYRRTLVGEKFFMTKEEGPNSYSVWMVPSLIVFRESLKEKNKGKMFFGKLDKLILDLGKYPPDSEFLFVTHDKIISWLKSKEQLTVLEPEYVNKRFYAIRKLMILNKLCPLFERIPFYKVRFKFK